VDAACGLSSCLAGEVELGSVLQTLDAPPLSFIPAGPLMVAPAELVGSVRMRQALAELRSQYDFVIVDTPPVLPVTDAVVLATMADAVVLVVKGHATPRALVLGLPLFLGGRQEWAVTAASAVILLLLGMTLRARRRRGRAPYPPGIAALAGLVALALATTLPLPPAVLRWIAPATARLYSEMLPGWPGTGGWALWRPLALDPYAAWAALGRFSIGLGAFVVAVSYPWRTRDPAGDGRPMVFARLLLTLIAGGVLLACLGLR